MLLLWLAIGLATAMVTLPDVLLVLVVTILLVSSGAAGAADQYPADNLHLDGFLMTIVRESLLTTNSAQKIVPANGE